MNYLDNIILGDNQFFGINHLSSEKGLVKEIYFQDLKNIIQTVEWAAELGATGVMLSTHPRAEEICKAIKSNAALRHNMNVYANIPYVAKYVREANENGIIGLLSNIFLRTSLADKMKIILKGGSGLIKNDLLDLLKILIDIEMACFSGLKVKAIFLHNVLTDIALGLDTQHILEFFVEYVTDRYDVLPGFGTLNLPVLIARLNDRGITNALVMASFNKKGLYMNPSKQAYEQCVSKYQFPLLANSVLASGAIRPKEAFDYVFSHKPDASIIVGASSRSHLEESLGLLRSHYKQQE